MRLLVLLLAAIVSATAATATPAVAQETAAVPSVPNFWDLRTRMARPDPGTLRPIRFLTTPDFEPFSFLDRRGALIGFNIDLARAVCRKLAVSCAIQHRPHETLAEALIGETGDAVIAGLSPERNPGELLAFTRPYLKIPARFAGPRNTSFDPGAAAPGTFVGVICDSAHAAYLQNRFPTLTPICFQQLKQVLGEVRSGRIPAAFADALSLSQWLHGEEEGKCCAFLTGSYIDDAYFGRGMSIAVRAEDTALRQALDYAMREVYRDGTYAELYLRYFPIGLF